MGERSDPHAPRGAGADSRAWLRAIVAGYLIYLGYSLIRDHLKGISSMAPWLSWTSGLLFIAAGAAFGFYTWKSWRAARQAAQTAEEPEGDDQPGG